MESYSEDSLGSESNRFGAKIKQSPTKLRGSENSTKAHAIVANKSASKKSPVKQVTKKNSKLLSKLAKTRVEDTWKVDYFTSDEDLAYEPNTKNIEVSSGDESAKGDPTMPQTIDILQAKKNSLNFKDREMTVPKSHALSFRLYDDSDDEAAVQKSSKGHRITIKQEVVSSEEDETSNRQDLQESADSNALSPRDKLAVFKATKADGAGSSCSDTEIPPSQFWLNRYKELEANDTKEGLIGKAKKSTLKKNSNSQENNTENKERFLPNNELTNKKVSQRKSPPRITKTEIVSIDYKRVNNKILNTEEERDSSIDPNETQLPEKRFIAPESDIDDNESNKEVLTKTNNSQESKIGIDDFNAHGEKASGKDISPRKKKQSLTKVQDSPKRKLSTKSEVLDIDSSMQEKTNAGKKSAARSNLNDILNGKPLKQRLSTYQEDTTSEEGEKPIKRRKISHKFDLSIDKLKNVKHKSPNSKFTQSVLVWKKNGQVSDNTELRVSHQQQLSPRKNSDGQYENSSEESYSDTASGLSRKSKLSPGKKIISNDESEAKELPLAGITKSQKPETDEQCQSNELTTKFRKRKLDLSDNAKIPTKRKHPDNHVSKTESIKHAKLHAEPNDDTMSDSDDTDSLTKLNTTINKSMAFIENKGTEMEMVKLGKNGKSVSINTKENLQLALNDSRVQKSILKKPEQVVSTTNNINTQEGSVQLITALPKIIKRPSNLQDLKDQESLVNDLSKASFGLDDVSDDDEIYIIDVPRTIDPTKMRGQLIKLGGKNKLQIEDQLYETSNKEPINISCVFRTDKEENSYQTVNVRPAGWINVRQRLSKTLHVELLPLEKRNVPFPDNLKTRHPLFGAEYEDKITIADNVLQKTSRSVTKVPSFQRSTEFSKIVKSEIRSDGIEKNKNKKLQLSQILNNHSEAENDRGEKVHSKNPVSSDSDSDQGFFQRIKRKSIDKFEERKTSNTNLSSILNPNETLLSTKTPIDSEGVSHKKYKELSSNKKSFASKNSSFDINSKATLFCSSTPIKTENIIESFEGEISMNRIRKRKNHSDAAKVTRSPKKAKKTN